LLNKERLKASKIKYEQTPKFQEWKLGRKEHERLRQRQYRLTPRYTERILRYKRGIKLETFIHYSPPDGYCSECGFSDLNALTIDHINGNGFKHRRELKNISGVTFYRWLRNNNYPKEYRVLCMNCQFIDKIKKRI